MSLYAKAAEALGRGERLIFASVVKASGSVPRKAGAQLIVFADGTSAGTVGGGLAEHVTIERAKQMLKKDQPRSYLERFTMNNKDAAEEGMVCGGTLTVFSQPFSGAKAASCFREIEGLCRKDKDSWLCLPLLEGQAEGSIGVFDRGGILCSEGRMPAGLPGDSASKTKGHTAVYEGLEVYIEPLVTQGRVLVFGGGHVAQALVPLLQTLDFKVAVYEDRPQFCTRELFREPAELVAGDFGEAAERLKINPGDYGVIMTRGHAADLIVLRQLLRHKLRYIGMMGSKRKVIAVLEQLRKEGFTDESFKDLAAPIGLEIGSETPAEIAVSIAAELIQKRAES